MTVAAFGRADEPDDRRHTAAGGLQQQPAAFAIMATFASLILLAGQRFATLEIAAMVAGMLALGTLALLFQGRTDLRTIAMAGGVHLGIVLLMGTSV